MCGTTNLRAKYSPCCCSPGVIPCCCSPLVISPPKETKQAASPDPPGTLLSRCGSELRAPRQASKEIIEGIRRKRSNSRLRWNALMDRAVFFGECGGGGGSLKQRDLKTNKPEEGPNKTLKNGHRSEWWGLVSLFKKGFSSLGDFRTA